MLNVCITGNIGSGKSTVCRQFARLGIPVYYTDTAAKRLMAEDEQLRGELTAAFGPETYLADGSLNRAYLAGRAFGDEAELNRLNGLVHPAVHRDFAKWRSRQKAPYTLYETALVYEIEAADRFDAVVVVTAPLSLRRTRVRARDGMTEEAFSARAARQLSEAEKIARADFLIQNDGKTLLFPQVLRLNRTLPASR